jgi:adenine-specific DNA-methyltransferase
MTLSLFTVESLDQSEDYLVFSAVMDDAQVVEEDVAQRLFSLPAVSVEPDADLRCGDALSAMVAERRAPIEQVI